MTTLSVPALDPDALRAEAENRTGLSDYGDPTLPERFGILVAKMRAAGMDKAGNRAAVQECLRQLTTRLQFFEDRKHYPIGDEVIEAPTFATGEARSGTTLLHVLLSLDPNARALRFWELMYPSPPPGLAGPDDPRAEAANEEWRQILQRIPRWLVNHPYNDMLGDGLPECERTWGFDFRVMGPTVWWRVPMKMVMSGLPSDPRAQYRLHKMVLQHCQYAGPKKRWVLKGFHSARLEELFETYPDAQVIWTHRDPVQSIASRIVMAGELDEGLTGEVDWPETAAYYLALSRQSIQATLRSPFVDDPRVHHVRYRDFVADPVATIRGFYDRYDLPFTPEFEAAMRHYLANNRSDRYGSFTYSTDIIGENVELLHEEFAPYRQRFGLEIEQQEMTLHEKVSVDALCFPGADLSEMAGYWRELHPRRIGFMSSLLTDDRSLPPRIVAEGGYKFEAMSHLFLWGHHIDADEETWAEERGKLTNAIDAVVAMGGGCIYLLTGGHGDLTWEDAAKRFSTGIAPCVAHAEAAGVRVCIETTSTLYADAHLTHTLRDTVLLAEMAGVGVSVDIYACWTEAGLEDTIKRAADRIYLVQASDYVYGDRSLPSRAVPGDGAIPLRRIFDWVLSAGYTGGFDLELIGPRIDAEGRLEATRRAAENVGDLLTELGV